MSRPPFDVLKWSFLLLSVVVLSELGMVLFAAMGCFWAVLSGEFKLGSCFDIGVQAREIFGELLTAVLALLLAGRAPPPPPPPDEQ